MKEEKQWKQWMRFCLTAVMGLIFLFGNSLETKAESYHTEFEEIPVYENGILIGENEIYYGQYDEHQEGILKSEDGKLKYYVDGKFQENFNGRLSEVQREGSKDLACADFLVKNGIFDAGFQGVVTVYNIVSGGDVGTNFYVVNGIISGTVFQPDPDDPSASMSGNATGLSVANAQDGIMVKYDANGYGDDCGFYIYRLCHETGEFVRFATLNGESTGFTDQDVERGRTYTYYIWTYSFYDMWGGNGYVCGFVDLTINYGGDAPGRTNAFESFTAPEKAEAKDPEWDISEDGVLTISGSGSMPEYKRNAPWSSRKGEIQSVVIEEGITTVGESAFSECRNLKSVSLASSVCKIEKGAFYNCKSLESVTLGEGLRIINDYAFQGTASLTVINLPASLGRISPLAFFESGLKRYELAEGSVFTIQEGILFSGDGKTLLSYPCAKENESYHIPSGVTVIDNSAFQSAALFSVDIPDSVKTIKRYVFTTSKIQTLRIPDSVADVGWGAFEGCKDLKELYLGNGIKSLDVDFARECSSLEVLSLGEGLETIPQFAFYLCSSLKTLELPASVKNIEYGAFMRCTSLESVLFQEGLERIDQDVFYGTALSSVDLPLSLSYIGKTAFPNGCKLNFAEGSRLVDLGGIYQEVFEAEVEMEYKYDLAFQVLELVNQERETNGLAAVKMDKDLLSAAMLRAGEISVYFNHTRPADQPFYSADEKITAENIAVGNNTAASVMQNWMNSTEHRNNILGEENIGIGIGCVDVNGDIYWVQVFSQSAVQEEADESGYQNESKVTPVMIGKSSQAQEGLIVYISKDKIKEGDKTGVTLYYNNGSRRYTRLYPESVGFSSSDPSVVSVSSQGEAFGEAKGKAEITAYLKKAPEIRKTVTITVEEKQGDTSGGQNPPQGGEQDPPGGSGEGQNPPQGGEQNPPGGGGQVSPDQGNQNPPQGSGGGGQDSSNGGSQNRPANGNQPDTGTQNRPENGEQNSSSQIKTGAVFTAGAYKYKVTSSKEASFAGFKNPKNKASSVKVPKSVKYKGQTFKVTSIAAKALFKSKVKKISFGAGIKSIGASAFEGCGKLNKVSMGKDVKKIGNNAFKKCTSLKRVTLPAKVSSIGSGVFSGCKKLESVVIKSAKMKVGKNAFKGIKSVAKIKVPAKKLSAYKKILKGKGQGKKVQIIK